MKKILITWTSWFIGYHLSKILLERWDKVIWIDNENNYYDPQLKADRRSELEINPNFINYNWSIEDNDFLTSVFKNEKPNIVVNLAAQAWVRYSIENPSAYIQTNIVWFANLIELSKNYKVENFLYASSASIYGWNTPPFTVWDKTDNPLSLYWASKKANELIAHSYSHIFWLNTTGLRFFNVLWPAGRPDWALYIFTKNIAENKTIDLFNYWKMKRNFTHVYDVVDCVIKSIDKPFKYEVFNIWNPNIVELNYFIERIEKELWKEGTKNLIDIQPGEIVESKVNIEHTTEKLWWTPKLDVDVMVKDFVDWFKDYHNYNK